MFKYYRGWRALWLVLYAFVLAVAVTNIVGGIGDDNSYQLHFGVSNIFLVGMFVIGDLQSGIIDRQNRVIRLMRGGLR